MDKFHLIRHINGALDGVRSHIQGRSRSGERRDLFRDRYALLKGAERLGEEERARLSRLFCQYPELERAWELKEGLRAWYS